LLGNELRAGSRNRKSGGPQHSIRPRDRVIFFALEIVVPELESAFLVEPKREST
jgi:hypothetical protein